MSIDHKYVTYTIDNDNYFGLKDNGTFIVSTFENKKATLKHARKYLQYICNNRVFFSYISLASKPMLIHVNHGLIGTLR